MPVDVLVLCRRLPPAPAQGWHGFVLQDVVVHELTGPAIEEALGEPLPFKAPKGILFEGTARLDPALVRRCLEPLVDAVAGELWTVDGRVIYRGKGRRRSFTELLELWTAMINEHQAREELAVRRSHARFKALAKADPDGVRAANDWSGVLPEGMDDLELSS
jgi:PAS domain-containing protein